MKFRIVKENELIIVGMGFYGDPFSTSSGWTEENEIGLLCKRFINFNENNPEAIKHIRHDDVMLEVHLETDETAEKGVFEVFMGVVVDKIEDVPLQCVIKRLPPIEYAVFTMKGREITSDWGRDIYIEWLPSSGYEIAYGYNIQYYDARFKGLDNIEESELDIYVPVKPVKTSG